MASPLLVVALILSVVCFASPAAARFRHSNFHDDLERQYKLGQRKRPVTSGNVQTLEITQPLDHFDRLNNATYQQTYWVNDQYWTGASGSPVFLYLGGEWEESSSTLEYGANVMSVWAKTFGGLMVDIQHRYYNGVPAIRDGNPAGIEYLASEQAIADVAAVVAHLNTFYAGNRSATGLKWIHMGGSYAGNMAAYYRLKYPHLSVGAFSISGPVEAVVDYTGFFAVEGHDLEPACLNTTRAAVRALDALVADEEKGWPQIYADFNVNFTSQLDTATWGFELTWGLLSDGELCMAPGATPYDKLVAAWGKEPFNSTYDPENVWSGYSYLWYYQTCTEFGFYQTGTDFDINPLQIAPKFLSPPYFTKACELSYGVKPGSVPSMIDFTNTVYGGKNITTSNTFFTHGDADGWSAAGITYTDRPVPVIGNSVHIIAKGTHCSDLYFPSDSDSPSLKAVHAAQLSQIKQWLS